MVGTGTSGGHGTGAVSYMWRKARFADIMSRMCNAAGSRLSVQVILSAATAGSLDMNYHFIHDEIAAFQCRSES